MLKYRKKAQAWGIDLMIAMIIFTVGIVIFYFYALNAPGEAKETMESLSYDGKIIMNTIFSEGYPLDWNPGNVVNIGILSDNKIDETKLENFDAMTGTDDDYDRTKILFNTRYDYYFFLDDQMVINSFPVDGIGKPGVNRYDTDYENLIKITRFTVYKGKPITAYLYIWKDDG